LIGYEVLDGDVPRAVLDQAATIVGLAVAPASREFIAAALYELKLETASRDLADEDLDALFDFRATALERQGYPADVIATAVQQLIDTQSFWPTRAEMLAVCDRLMRERRMLLEALRRGPPPKPSDEEIARRRQYATDKAEREASAAEWQAANPDGGPPSLTPRQAIVAEVTGEDHAAARKRVAEDDKNWKPIPLPTPFIPSASYAAAEAALQRRNPAPPKPEEEQP
jgi:hypothetical protein